MTAYRKSTRPQYSMTRKHSVLRSTISRSSSKSKAVQSNMSSLALFLAKILSGKADIVVSPIVDSKGYSVSRTEAPHGRTRYNIKIPDWNSYKLPLDDKDKYRIYRSGVWHEAEHIKHTPDGVYEYGATGDKVTRQLEHDVINILEDRLN